jgi:ribulose-phosphate 3-epimerase
MKKIVPAVLTDSKEKLVQMLDICAGFTDYVQIDIMDGEFVPSTSISVSDLEGIRPFLGSEAHLMVKKPLVWIDAFKSLGSKRIIYHFEIEEDHSRIIEEIRAKNLEVGLAVNPDTTIDDFRFLIDKVDTVLFMAVNPGFYGAPFIPSVLDKIKQFKTDFPQKLAGIDGGVKLDNVKDVAASGVDYICVGSAILKEDNPGESYIKLLRMVNG